MNRHPTLSALADTAAADDTPAPPEWPPRRRDIPWTPPEGMRSAALVGEASGPWSLSSPDHQRAERMHQRFLGRLEGAAIGFVLALVCIVAGCTLFAVADGRAAPVSHSIPRAVVPTV